MDRWPGGLEVPPITNVFIISDEQSSGLKLTGVGKSLDTAIKGGKKPAPKPKTIIEPSPHLKAKTAASLGSLTAPFRIEVPNGSAIKNAASVPSRPSKGLHLAKDYKVQTVHNLAEVRPYISQKDPAFVFALGDQLKSFGFHGFPGEFKAIDGINYKIIGQSEGQFYLIANLARKTVPSDKTDFLEELFDRRTPVISGLNQELAESGGTLAQQGLRLKFSEVIASGGQGSAYKGSINDQAVVIKAVSEKDDIAREAFFMEHMAGSSHTAQVFGTFKGDDGSFYMVLESLPRSFEGLSFDQKTVNQLLAGLDEIHARGVAHQDIKPANILATEAGEPKFIDFGVSAKIKDPGYTEGSPQFMTRNGLRVNGLDRDILGMGLSLAKLRLGVEDLSTLPSEALKLRLTRELTALPETGKYQKILEWKEEIIKVNPGKANLYRIKEKRLSSQKFQELIINDLSKDVRSYPSMSDGVADYLILRDGADTLDEFIGSTIKGRYKSIAEVRSSANAAFTN